MRMSDWSSDVCSSDLPPARWRASGGRHDRGRADRRDVAPIRLSRLRRNGRAEMAGRVAFLRGAAFPERLPHPVREVRVRRRLAGGRAARPPRSEEHTSELQSLMRISYAVFCLKKNKIKYIKTKYKQRQ